MHPEAARATLSRPARCFNAGASERSRPLWPGMNAELTVSGGKHALVMKRVSVGQDKMMYVNIAAYIINNVNNVPVGQI